MHIKKTKILTKPKAFHQGVKAFKLKFQLTDNPYNKFGYSDTGKAAWWVTGYNYQKSEILIIKNNR